MHRSAYMLARGFRRRRELAVRLALGAGRSRLLRLLMTEGLTLSLIGGLAGGVVAFVVGALVQSRLPAIDWAHGICRESGAHPLHRSRR